MARELSTLLASTVLLGMGLTQSCIDGPPAAFENPDLELELRVEDLVSRMTLDEKVSQLTSDAAAIERLGVPKYNWWNECLHGVGRAGQATVFPQAIGMAATWDSELMLRIATVISDEARAKHHEFVRRNKRDIYQGLTFWSPNINIFRDPRWGRGMETYGEDPHLTGQMAYSFIKGLQGNDPKYLKVIATAKHYAVHSGPEPDRHTFNARTSERDLRETYLPHFEVAIRDAGAFSVMCAYNRFEDEACCGSDRLLSDVLREEWGFGGYVVSDCGAIRDIHANHKIVGSAEEAAAIGVQKGCDLNCGIEYSFLRKAFDEGLISEEEITVSVKRLFRARFLLGMFDPPERVAYAQIPYEVVNSAEHRQVALEAARKSIVLLKNEKDVLPLEKDLKTLAVIGPNADDLDALVANYNGDPIEPVTLLEGIRRAVSSETEVLYAFGCRLAENLPDFEVIPSSALFTSDGSDRIG
jgi:beta-glucosidase